VAKVEEVVPTLGFDQEAKGRILASLTSRLNGLRSAGKGKMLDVQESFPIEALLSSPTVLELEGMGDDDDKAFLIGLLLIRLFEIRAIEGNRDELKHLLVIEEAHRILTNVARSSNQEQADPRGKAVESFTNLLSEIRSYGQGVVISDQVPTRLAPDVLKNTNLKICHRIVSGDDREILGKTMAMSERQIGALNSLTTDKIRNMNQAVVFSGELDDAPILVEVKYAKPPVTEDVRSGRAVIQRAVAGFNANTLRLLRSTVACQGICDRGSESADAARALETRNFEGLHNVLQKDPECSTARRALDVESCRSAVAKLAVSFIENPRTVETLWRDVCAAAAAHRRNGMDEHRLQRCLAVRAAAWISDRRGAQAGWSYAQTTQFEAALRTLLLTLADGTGQITATASFREASDQFRRVAAELHARTFSPYPRCEQICSQGALPTCLYRFGAADELAADVMKPAREKVASLVRSTEGKEELWSEAVKAGCRIIAVPNDVDDEGSRGAVEQSLIRASLCVAQQLLSSAPNVHARDADFALDGFLKQRQNV